VFFALLVVKIHIFKQQAFDSAQGICGVADRIHEVLHHSMPANRVSDFVNAQNHTQSDEEHQNKGRAHSGG